MARKRSRTKRDPEIRDRERRVNAQEKSAAVRAKYGPRRRPSPVTVRSMETGDVLRVEDQGKFRTRTYSPVLDAAARNAGFDGYSAYIDSPYWKTVRERVLDRDGRRCVLCRTASRLSVHHDRYDRLGNERLEHLKTVCAGCHGRVHK